VKTVSSAYGPGVIGVIAGSEVGRFNHLGMSMSALIAPEGSLYTEAWGCNPAKNCNILAQIMLEDPAMQWLWIMGDDHCFNEDVLMRLLAHDVDCVMPLTPRRTFPYDPVLWRDFDPSRKVNRWYTWNEIEKFSGKPFHVAAGGSAGLLVKRRVFEDAKMPRPWFQIGQFDKEELHEDTFFTMQANKAGHQVYCDPSVILGHVITTVLFPKYHEGQIGVAANLNGHKQFIIPPGYTAIQNEDGVSAIKIPFDWINKPGFINQRAATGEEIMADMRIGSPDEDRPPANVRPMRKVA
jgi:hypothetical protein